jgi:hypothetical protein
MADTVDIRAGAPRDMAEIAARRVTADRVAELPATEARVVRSRAMVVVAVLAAAGTIQRRVVEVADTPVAEAAVAIPAAGVAAIPVAEAIAEVIAKKLGDASL